MKLGEEEGEEPAAVKQEPQGSVDGAAGVTGFFLFPLALITNGQKLISVSDVKTKGNGYILCPLLNLLQTIKISVAIVRLHISDRGGDTDPFSVAEGVFGPFPMCRSVLVTSGKKVFHPEH